MKLAGLEIKTEQTTYKAFFMLMLIPVLVVSGYAVIFHSPELELSTFGYLLLLGVCFAVYHQIAQFIHQLGHALAARATGYPMMGIRYDYVFTYSEYPLHEQFLPDRVHIQRSLGGVVGNTLMLALVIFLWTQTGVTAHWFTRWLLTFLLFDALMLFIGSAVVMDGLLFIWHKNWKET
ncbi:MAG: hypothetical protein R3C14_49530 [Caldilineaceae bacterium]